jgi:hypothetical protein
MATGDRKQCETCGTWVRTGPPEAWRSLSPPRPLSDDPEVVRRRGRARRLAENNRQREA